MYEAVQSAEIVIVTAPIAYHYGVKLDYNKAEAINYANPTWLDVSLYKNLISSNKKMNNSVLIPFEYIPRSEVDLVLPENRERGLQETTK